MITSLAVERIGPGALGLPLIPAIHARTGRWVRIGRTIILHGVGSPPAAAAALASFGYGPRMEYSVSEIEKTAGPAVIDPAKTGRTADQVAGSADKTLRGKAAGAGLVERELDLELNKTSTQGVGGRTLDFTKGRIGSTDGGPGIWLDDFEGAANMSDRARAYQEQITGVSGLKSYLVKNKKQPNEMVRFDGWNNNRKVLLDAKDWSPWFVVTYTGRTKQARKRRGQLTYSICKQARIAESNNVRVEWVLSDRTSLEWIQKYLVDWPELKPARKHFMLRHEAPDQFTTAASRAKKS